MPHHKSTAELNLPGHLNHRRLSTLLGYHLAQASVPTNNLFKIRIGLPFQLSKLDFTILMLLSANESVTPKRLSAAMNIPASNLTLIVDRLVARELVARERSNQDRRVQYMALTDKGTALAQEVIAVSDVMENDLLQHLTLAEQAMLLELLRKIAVHRKN
jgi:DNA-binding MarR family transcriptional regulator